MCSFIYQLNVYLHTCSSVRMTFHRKLRQGRRASAHRTHILVTKSQCSHLLTVSSPYSKQSSEFLRDIRPRSVIRLTSILFSRSHACRHQWCCRSERTDERYRRLGERGRNTWRRKSRIFSMFICFRAKWRGRAGKDTSGQRMMNREVIENGQKYSESQL